jgi:hypothetical protein
MGAFSFVHHFCTAILHEPETLCKGRRCQKDENDAFLHGYILPKNIKSIRGLNFYSGKSDIFNVDRGWYNISIMEYYVFVCFDLPVIHGPV